MPQALIPLTDGQLQHGSVDGEIAVKESKASYVDVFGPSYATKYTKNDAGQQSFLGITPDGMTRYRELMAANTAARASDNGKQVEKDFLEKWQVEIGVRVGGDEGQIAAGNNRAASQAEEEAMAERAVGMEE